ncbi:MAG TPA: TIGR03086 family metal-binding protein [Candidatus Limnocylindrales bacterium]|nr:TIGR03086 family metal-binding protein [Candidatus Limnocylindrales bacterium]
MDWREFNRLVLESIDDILRAVKPEHLALPTPCAEWTLDDLLRHMIGQHRGFAAAARGEAPDPAVSERVVLGPDPYETYRAAAEEVIIAFINPVASLFIYGYGEFPPAVVWRMHSVDYLAHGWDVAKTIGVPSDLDPGLCATGLEVARRWPETSFSSGDPFAAHVPIADEASVDQRLMAYLGRDPDWGMRA